MFGAYAAANAYLESLARHLRRHRAVRTDCFAWSAWAGLGMSREYQGRAPLRARGFGFEEMSAEQGVRSLLAAWHRDRPNLLIGLDGDNLSIRRYLEDGPPAARTLFAYYTTGSGRPLADGEADPGPLDRFGSRSMCTLVRLREMPMTESGEVDRDRLAAEVRRSGPGRRARPAPDQPRATAGVDLSRCPGHAPSRRPRRSFRARWQLAPRGPGGLAGTPRAGPRVAPPRPVPKGPLLSDWRSTSGPGGARGEAPRGRSSRRRGGIISRVAFAQLRFWFIDQLVSDDSSYNIYSAFKIDGPLNVVALERSLEEIVRRHEAPSRTIFPVRRRAARPGHTSGWAAGIAGDGYPGSARRRPRCRRLAGPAAAERSGLRSGRGPALSLRSDPTRGGREPLRGDDASHCLRRLEPGRLQPRAVGALIGEHAAWASSPLPDSPIQYVDWASLAGRADRR